MPESVCPGYRQVQEFGADEEYEDEETIYVTLDLGNIEPTLVPTSTEYRLIGLDTSTPFLQLSGTIFKGQHDALLGTEILLTEAKGTHDQDRSKRYITPIATTEHRIRFREVQLVPKNAASEGVSTVPRGGENELDEDQVDQPVTLVIPEAHTVDRMTGVIGPTPRKSGNTKGKGKKAKRQKITSESQGEPGLIAEEIENVGSSSRLPENHAMDVDGD